MTLETTSQSTIVLTPMATQAVKNLLEKRNLQGFALRVFVTGGGCSGLQYGMALEQNVRNNDLTWDFDGVKVVVDEISIQYLNGAVIDYVEGIMESGFKINNPNALTSCACGSSFNTQKEGGASQRSSGCACH